MRALFYIPATGASLDAFLDRLNAVYDAIPDVTTWTLQHRSYRSTNTLRPAMLQILDLPRICCPTGNPLTAVTITSQLDSKTTAIGIPYTADGNTLQNLLTSKLGPLWQTRAPVTISHGQTIGVGDAFTVFVGELKQQTIGKGLICEVRWRTKSGDEAESRRVIEAFWAPIQYSSTPVWLSDDPKDPQQWQNEMQIWLELIRVNLDPTFGNKA